MPQEDQRRRTETNRKRKNCREKVTFPQDYNKRRGPDHGSEQCVRGQDLKRNQNYTNDGPTRNSSTAHQKVSPRPSFEYESNNPNNGRPYDQCPNQSFNGRDGNRSLNESSNNQNGKW